MNAEELIVELRNIIKRFEEEYQDAVDKTVKARKETDSANESLKAANDLLEKRKTEVATEITWLDLELATERDVLKAARLEKAELLDGNATLKIDNARLDEENRKFREYEAQAHKVLDAKDESLKARAIEITETEILLANRSSFLPKKD